jgi:NADH-quinone oxidoreductase subunit B
MPVNVYIPGCPPRPESLLDALLKIREIVDGPLAAAVVAAAPEPVKGST